MQAIIQISKLNDFIFCPYSIYLHSIYNGFSNEIYTQVPQKRGKIHHNSIDKAQYSTEKRYLQAISVYSEKYKLNGKIDIYDTKTKSLVDRKYRIKKIYDGYKYQLYAQYFAMIEQNYIVENLFLHSLSDNKRYKIDIPVGKELNKFENLIKRIWEFYSTNEIPDVPASKCFNCIYNSLCPYAKSS